MTPMIDVVFLLIIFFLVSSHLAKQESQLELELPNAISGQDDIDQDVPRVTVNVKKDGGLWIGGRQIRADQLRQTFAAVLKKEGEQLEVRIRGSQSAPYSTVEPIMLACTEVGIWNVKYAVYREESE